MSSNRIFRENQVILVCDLREFCTTLSSISKNSKKDDKFFSYMDFYLKSLFEM
ncbi:MAG: hypothetical protein GY950_32615, partial [bacterium]|nr:hypothetical protein [bacterium]